ncbi:MAG: DUF547 domain-containing protein [Deltaproteobacteria bacterium]|nr:DUF547 domain-containing protein [Deltaproteobacteria bacterium]MBW2658053.1 DUF547 domain-containing protein [Deltaproteobacteria bacterium]
MIRVLMVVIVFFTCIRVEAASFDHGRWDLLLQQHVAVLGEGRVTQVDYDGFLNDRGMLKKYLQSLSAVDRTTFDGYQPDQQLAFLINAYNSWTVEMILTGYPGVESIKDLGSFFQSPWKKKFIPLLEKTRSLDDIEHNLIRGSGRYNDPRIHFAVNCASIGCPPLRAEAYTGEKLQTQLTEAVERFLSDRERNRLSGRQLEISSLFKWYRQDFEKGWRGYRSLDQFLADFGESLGLDKQTAEEVRSGTIDITFLQYDWKLNGKK